MGRLIGKHASPGDVCLMVGDLGAGKTCLSQGIAWGLGIKGYIMSPSFVLVREYRQGRLPLFHMDLYRLQDINELQDIGIDEYLYSDGICVIEWAEKGMNLLPRGHLLVNIDTDPDDTRIFTIKATDEKHLNLLSHLSR
ncbi:MAG: tRNA (adenosine(37)-N6)-threonylcarbamoyltransferase complex ATPase subunit type 1 TsaE [Dehalococcoidia bacterium]|nr:tRNA (adenosine(37)-N6)-threonylcarbamoyltransferase complex ATPase subunit type 1 TsaE [Dehalococcoidia bacterium]MDZ4247075.1 tRNA (adenosine(37)-N6)-threonylcarbamoyltransferase complex ATPase subunit type 1 TsaE [Dehalococcoidia bacterium]